MKNKVINLFGDNKIVQNTGVKYSTLLEQFLIPFANDFKHLKYIEDIFEFAIKAWNTALLNNILPTEEVNEGIQFINRSKKEIFLLKKMMAYKEEKFKEYTKFIVDFELTPMDGGGDPILTVVTQDEDAYFANMINTVEEEYLYDENNFEENYINRSAIILKPQQPFFDWLNKLYPNHEIHKVSEANVYLITDEEVHLEIYLKKKYDKFFMLELGDWHNNKKEWPQKRNYKMFKQWFQVEVSSMIYDLEKGPVYKSE